MENVKELQECLIGIQQELKAPKGQYNSFGKYRYRSAEDILEAVKPLLKKYGCTLMLSDDIAQFGDRTYIKSTAILMHGAESASTQAFAREPLTKKGMDDSQITGTASSYARKYALNGMFCIDDTKDPDTDEYHNQQSCAGQRPARPVSRKDNPRWQAFYNKVAQEVSLAKSAEDVTAIYNTYLSDAKYSHLALDMDECFKRIFNDRINMLGQ